MSWHCRFLELLIFTHGLLLFLPIHLLQWLALIHRLLCARHYSRHCIILSTSLHTHNNTAKQIGFPYFTENFSFPFLIPLLIVNILPSFVLLRALQPCPHHERKALKPQCGTGRSVYQSSHSSSVAKLAFDHKLSDTDLGKVTSLDYIDFLDK